MLREVWPPNEGVDVHDLVRYLEWNWVSQEPVIWYWSEAQKHFTQVVDEVRFLTAKMGSLTFFDVGNRYFITSDELVSFAPSAWSLRPKVRRLYDDCIAMSDESLSHYVPLSNGVRPPEPDEDDEDGTYTYKKPDEAYDCYHLERHKALVLESVDSENGQEKDNAAVTTEARYRLMGSGCVLGPLLDEVPVDGGATKRNERMWICLVTKVVYGYEHFRFDSSRLAPQAFSIE